MCSSDLNKCWITLERQWKAGRIGSRQCLTGQLRGLYITKKRLDDYLSCIKLDPYFRKLIFYLNSKKVKLAILSDNFDYIIRRLLKRKGFSGIRVYSNRLQFSRDRLMPSFPLENKSCRICAHCKTDSIKRVSKNGSKIIYIGDGRSDICPARKADIIFAKDALLDYCRENNLDYIPYRSLKTVYAYLKRSLG